MSKMKKTAVAVLAFGSSVAFAGTMGPVCNAVNVTVPCERTAWDVGIKALYLRPSYNDEVSYLGVLTSGNAVTYVENEPDWGWGFQLEGSYHFSTGNDLNLNWYHLDNNARTRNFTGAFTFTDEIVGAGNDSFTIDPHWDAVNLEFGQHVDFGEFKNIRFHGGVQYARIRTALTASGNTTGTTLYYNGASNSRFNGFGPRIGADMSYDIGNGFAVYGNGATAILSGTSKVATAFGTTGQSISTAYASRTAIVPELEAKLGLMYTYAMPQGDLTLDAGYMWVNYFHTQEIISPNSGFPQSTDFALQGPYIGLKWVGTVV